MLLFNWNWGTLEVCGEEGKVEGGGREGKESGKEGWGVVETEKEKGRKGEEGDTEGVG